MIDRNTLKELIYKSQRCQRNWDLSKEIPKEDVDTMIHAIKSAPSKQNEKHFQVSIISNYHHRFAIYNATHNFAHKEDGVTIDKHPDGSINYKRQSQLIGNLLFVFSRDVNDEYRSGETFAGGKWVKKNKKAKKILHENNQTAGRLDFKKPGVIEKNRRFYEDTGLHALGIGVGYLLLTAHLLGYKTGCSRGFHEQTVRDITGMKDSHVIVAVGYHDPDRDRTEEHFEAWRRFPSWDKDRNIQWV